MRYIGRVFIVLILVVSTGCAGSGSGSSAPAPRRQADLITFEEIEGKYWPSAYELVASLRGNWLHGRGPDSFSGQPGEVQVHMDGMRLGGVQRLREIPVADIESIRYLDPMTSAARFGLDHNHGAIIITTRVR